MKWISIADQIPPDRECAYLVCGHEWIGIANWIPRKGFSDGFIIDSPMGPYSFHDNESKLDDYLNENVMFWGELPEYNDDGVRGYQSLAMKCYFGNCSES